MMGILLRRMCLVLVLGCLTVLGSFSVVSADGPIIEGPTYFEGSSELGDCGSFKIVDNFTLDLTAIRFYDMAGNLERVIAQGQGTDTLTNSETGKAYSGSFHNTFILNLDRLTGPAEVNAGVSYRVTVPGAGAVVLDVGLFMFNLNYHFVYFGAGPHQVIEGDFDALCAVLA